MIDTVVFDLGKVLVDFHPRKAMEELEFSSAAIKAFEEKIFTKVWEECDGYPISNADIRQLFKSKVPDYADEVDLLWDNITKITGVYDYSYKWVSDLKKRGYKIYILSNFGEQAFENNSRLYTFLELTDGRVMSYDVSMVKPNRDIYEHLIKTYNISPQNAVFIDDRKVNIDAARECGFNGIVFENYEDAREKLEDLLTL